MLPSKLTEKEVSILTNYELLKRDFKEAKVNETDVRGILAPVKLGVLL